MAEWGSFWGWTSFQMDYLTIQQTATPIPTPTNSIPPSNQTLPAFCIESNSTVSALAFNSTTQEISFTVSGPNDTTGYVNITISKTLLPNLAGLKIYIDKQDINFTANTIGDSQVLYFAYHHSTHNITIHLPSTETAPEFQAWMLLPLLGCFAVAVVVFKFKKASK